MSANPSVAIIDCGVNNLYSISKALASCTDRMFITDDAGALANADAAVLPGVGSFEAGMQGLFARGLTDAIRAFADSGKPLLGICLGAQMLFTRGYEFGAFDGLNIIQGDVVRFPSLSGAKIPHIGWNEITTRGREGEAIFDGLAENPVMYFVHSYILKPADAGAVLAETEHGGHKFCSVARQGRVFGCQFHPEKSGAAGLSFIKNFISLV